MATFTAMQASQIRMYLGYPDLFRYQDERLEGVISGDQTSPEVVILVTGLLASLTALDVAIGGHIVGGFSTLGVAGSIAGLKRAEDVEFYQGQGLIDLREVGRLLAGRISSALGVPFFADAFGGAGYPGDNNDGGGGGGFASVATNVLPWG